MSRTELRLARRLAELKDEIAEIGRDYEYSHDVMDEEDARARVTKQVMRDVLTPRQRELLVLYFSEGSYRRLGKKVEMSHSTVYQEVVKIIEIVRNEIDSRSGAAV